MNKNRHSRRRRGTASVEFALIFPLLAMMAIGTIDFGRIFYNSIALVNASHVAAFYGSQSNVSSVDSSGMVGAATTAGVDAGTMTAEAEHYCDCPDSPATGPDDTGNVVACLGTTCPNGYGTPRVFVRSRIVQEFDTFSVYPGIPNDPQIQQEGFMRVQ